MARIRCQCSDCAKKGKGGYFTVKNIEKKEIKCPYCGSSNVKVLG